MFVKHRLLQQVSLCHTHQSQDPQYKRNPSFYTKKERKEAVKIHLHRPNPRSAKFSLLEPCKRNQEKNRRKKKLQPANQPRDSFVSQDNEIHLPPKEERNLKTLGNFFMCRQNSQAANSLVEP